jgi:hypothetical protein
MAAMTATEREEIERKIAGMTDRELLAAFVVGLWCIRSLEIKHGALFESTIDRAQLAQEILRMWEWADSLEWPDVISAFNLDPEV